MLAKLRPIGNSIGMTIPASELKALRASPGDLIEVQITRVVRHARDNWDDPKAWQGAADEPLYLEGLPDTEFDKNGEWQW